MAPRRTEQQKLHDILGAIKSGGWSVGDFLRVLFTDFRSRSNLSQAGAAGDNKENNVLTGQAEGSGGSTSSPTKEQMQGRQSTMLSQFLRFTPDESTNSVGSILSMIYGHHLSAPVKHRSSASGPAKPDADSRTMARHFMLTWARCVVAETIDSEIKHLATCPQLRLPTAQINWATMINFSFEPIQQCVKSTAPILHNLLVHIATRSNSQSTASEGLQADPKIVATVSTLMITSMHNQQANAFQKFMGVWLFSCSAPAQIYRVLGRLSLTVAYNTVLRTLVQLSDSSVNLTRTIALEKDFILVIDNINQRRRHWKPDFGQQDMLMSGTAATLVEAVHCPPNSFDPTPVIMARAAGNRQELTAAALWRRIDQAHLSSVMSLHCLNFLVSACPVLLPLREYTNNKLRTTFAIH
ncbi:hypothetical protein RSOLAG1IB_12180 [Rhizoctonia solani AG-1 IB]|uniref:Uncharacterized protein n=1 Tax=Thanatephorus cucumeris (strain AG1-IB / isolate 7/3/14) TaxID=1108050 RepID=A0A0B7FM07_THACB|nr:hypothetical protein RSOLAG1IB_12180 [Rhizoctonia solani AG-1 IB]